MIEEEVKNLGPKSHAWAPLKNIEQMFTVYVPLFHVSFNPDTFRVLGGDVQRRGDSVQDSGHPPDPGGETLTEIRRSGNRIRIQGGAHHQGGGERHQADKSFMLAGRVWIQGGAHHQGKKEPHQ